MCVYVHMYNTLNTAKPEIYTSNQVFCCTCCAKHGLATILCAFNVHTMLILRYLSFEICVLSWQRYQPANLGSRPSFLAARIFRAVVFASSRWPRTMWWSADRDIKYISKSGAVAFLTRFWLVFGPGRG